MSTNVSTATSVTTVRIEGSTKQYQRSGDVRVPVRRVHLTHGEHLDVDHTVGSYTSVSAASGGSHGDE
ncbi:hypothetical protein [Rhodococcus opacus]|uniref:hypothetical protein n=1 Tax=Rhodococcus opacus TaxID=37919 RepID=UPI00294983C8|nr:hypothetical protein [Rhodococcus opacus]MDV6247068.1 hypothetical protein [Rhodococcus opacus]